MEEFDSGIGDDHRYDGIFKTFAILFVAGNLYYLCRVPLCIYL